MGSMLKFDSDRRELVRERRQARMERKTLRRKDREPQAHRRPTPIPTASTNSTLSATQRAADERVRDDVDRIVEQALDRHDQRAATGNTVAPTAPTAPTAPITPDIAARRPALRPRPVQVQRSLTGHAGNAIAGRRRAAHRRRRRRGPGAAGVASRA